MPQLVALSLSIAVLGGIWAFIALSLSAYLVVWAGFIAWGCFFHSGGDQKALIKTICGNVYGIIVAWIALLLIINISGGTVVNAIIVGVTVFFLVIVAKIDQLSVVPANVYGYAAMVALALPVLGTPGVLTSPSFVNPLVIMIVSMVIGAIAGYVSGLIAGALTKKAAAA